MSEHRNRELALQLWGKDRWDTAHSADVLAAAGERVGHHGRIGRALWDYGTSRWVSLYRCAADLKDAVSYFERRLPGWEWSLRKMGHSGYVCYVGRHDESGTDRLVARTAEGALCLGLLHALDVLPMRGPWVDPLARPPGDRVEPRETPSPTLDGATGGRR